MRPPRVRLSVRVLMVLVLVAGGLLGVVYRAKVQREAVAGVEQTGGQVFYDWQWSGGHPTSPGAKPPWPGWIMTALGPDYLANVVAVSLGPATDDALLARVGRLSRLKSLELVEGRRITDNGLIPIGELRRLEYLNLSRCNSISDAGLAHLRGLSELMTLELDGTNATGYGLRHLVGMTRLNELVWPDGAIDDADLAHLRGLTDLKRLQIRGLHPTLSDWGLSHLRGLVNLKDFTIHSPKITSAGLDALRNMKQLRTLGLGRCGVSDLSPIRHLSELTSLNLSGSPIDDAGLTAVRELIAIEDLYLADTRITDAGLIHLSDLRKLQTLSLERTQVTDFGITNLSGLDACHQITLRGEGLTDVGIAAAGRNKPGTKFIKMSR